MSASITELRLTNFRSYGAIGYRFEPQGAALVGPNGAGKTNLLEALSLMAPGRGIRRAGLKDMSRVGHSDFVVFARLTDATSTMAVGTGVRKSPEAADRRVIKLDGREVSSDDLQEHVRMLWVGPETDREFIAAKPVRRGFVDRFACVLNASRLRLHIEMGRALRSRSVLLDQRSSSSSIDALDKELARLFASVHEARMDAIGVMQERIDDSEDTSFPKVDLKLVSGWDEEPSGDVEVFALDTLRRRRPVHLASGRTTEGPHRADLDVRHRSKQREIASCSTGEQKAMVVAMVIAQAQATWHRIGVPPIMLLDEICSHLDEWRRRDLFRLLSSIGCQVFCTGTDVAAFECDGAPPVMLIGGEH